MKVENNWRLETNDGGKQVRVENNWSLETEEGGKQLKLKTIEG